MPINEDKLRELFKKIADNQEALYDAMEYHKHDKEGDTYRNNALHTKRHGVYDEIREDEIYDAIECEPEEEETDDGTTKKEA